MVVVLAAYTELRYDCATWNHEILCSFRVKIRVVDVVTTLCTKVLVPWYAYKKYRSTGNKEKKWLQQYTIVDHCVIVTRGGRRIPSKKH
jgi:hypothetical protein